MIYSNEHDMDGSLPDYTDGEKEEHRIMLADALLSGDYHQTCGAYFTNVVSSISEPYVHHCAVGVAFDVMSNELGYPKFMRFSTQSVYRFYGIIREDLVRANESNPTDINMTFPEIANFVKNYQLREVWWGFGD